MSKNKDQIRTIFQKVLYMEWSRQIGPKFPSLKLVTFKKMHFFLFLSFHLSCSSETLSRRNAHEKSKPILPFDGKFNVDAENGVVFEF